MYSVVHGGGGRGGFKSFGRSIMPTRIYSIHKFTASTQRNSFVSTAYLSLSSAFQLGLCDPLELHDTIQCMQFSYRLLGHSEKNVKFYFS